MFVKVIRLILLFCIPIVAITSAIWFMEHESFEDIVRTGMAIIITAILVAGWIITFKDFLS